MKQLGVASKPTQMSFSVSDQISGIEYAGTNLNTLFGRRKNLLSPTHYKMLREILRFNTTAEKHLEAYGMQKSGITLGEYLELYSYSDSFKNLYIVPMGSAIWSSRQSDMLKMPLEFFVKFFRNHGLLNIKNRPQWRVIEGGSSSYIEPLIAPFKENIRLNTPVIDVKRLGTSVRVDTKDGTEEFDHVIFACHSDQALGCLEDASVQEQEILAAIPYSKNEVVLHTDISVLPRTRRCWSSWNVSLGAENEIPCLSYNMNILQGIESDTTFCVTLNQTEMINPDRIIGVYHYDHPIFSAKGVAAQSRWDEINGTANTWYCGAYWRNGFHEDGVWSASRVCDNITAAANRSIRDAA